MDCSRSDQDADGAAFFVAGFGPESGTTGRRAMITRKLSAGDIIEAQCTRCRKLLNHTIVAMVEERVVRVQCNTCGGAHNYRPIAEPKTPAARATTRKAETAPRTSKKDQGAAEREEWESLRPALESGQSLPYDMNGTYRVNSVVAHPVFGLGVVKCVIKPDKMEVLFQAGKKLLRCR